MCKKVVVPTSLPQKGVLFLGGHQNMTKKLRQLFPEWNYVTDDCLMRARVGETRVVFYWTGHTSHKMMRYVYSRLSPEACVLYVAATNLQMLVEEMQRCYSTQSKGNH